MKATIFQIKRFAVHDGDGIRTTVFFKGCPLKCKWCHNPEGLSFKPQIALHQDKCIGCGECFSVCPNNAHVIDKNNLHIIDRSKCVNCGKCAEVCLGNALNFYGKETTVDQLLDVLLEDFDFYQNSNGGVTLSGGECLCQADFCTQLLLKLKENKVHTAVDTCGFVDRTAIDKVLPYTDVFLFDVKAFYSDTHARCTGKGNELILDNLKYIDDKGKKIEIRIPFVPNFNDKEIVEIAKFLSTLKNVVKVKVLPYHNYAGSKYTSLNMENTLPLDLPTNEQIESAKKVLREFGLNA